MQCTCVVLYCHSGLSVFTPQSLTRLNFGGGGSIRHKMCVLILTVFVLSEIFLVIRRTVRGIIINVYKFHVKCSLFLLDFNQTWIFPTDFRKKIYIYWNIKFHKPLSVGAEFLRADGRTDKYYEVNSRFSLYWECAPYILHHLIYSLLIPKIISFLQ